MVALGEVATIDRRGVDPRSLPPDTAYLGLEHIQRGGRIIARSTVAEAELASTKFQFSSEHVLFGKLRPNLCKISRPNFGGVCSTDILPIRPSRELDRDYLALYLSQPGMVDFAASRTSGANLPRLSPAVLAQFPVPLPPLPDQHRIAAILDQADALRAKRRQVLAHLDALTQSIYFKMFEGRRWPTMPLAELADSPDDIKCGPFGTQLNASEFRSSGVPLLGIKNVNAKFDVPPFEFLDETTASRLSAYDLRPGDLVMTRKGTIGNCAIYPATLATGVMHSDLLRARISSQAADLVFLEHHLQLSPHISHQIRMMSPGAVMPGINVTKLKQLAVDTPPMAVQREFAARVGAISRQRAAVRQALASDDELVTSLQSRAFDGRL